ncbi:MAG TPA: Ig-like domain-containing protein [Myxococcaceae bacterium]|nr:Ig-like domain-containing protein [Myxococcaceae bacterium]
MLRAARLASVAGVLALYAACNSSNSGGVAALTVTATPLQIDARGTVSLLGVQARDANGGAGTGQVTLTVASGSFSDGTKQTTLTLANGTAGIGYSCNASTDSSCSGQVRIDATWNQLSYTVLLSVTTNGGGGNPDGGNPDGGGGGTINIGYITLTASKSPIFFGVGDSSNITAQLSSDAGTVSGQTIGFSANLGGFSLPDGGTSSSVSATTGSDGKATAQFHETGTAGTATIVATHAPSNSIASINLPIVNIQAITWVSTKCNGVDCTIMGIRGSGFNEQATVTFKVVDSSNNPALGVRVTFSLTNPPTGMSVTPSGVTDANGLVSANLSVGPVIGALTVKATVIPGQIETQSPNIGVRGAKPSNQGFVIDCDRHNLAAFATPTPPLELTTNCKVTLVDRFNNPVGTGTSVDFLSEAGTIPSTVSTVAYTPGQPNPAEGTATIIFSTRGQYQLIADTDPLAANPSQWPNPRFAEPSISSGGLIRNPRDGLVTLIAFTRGEEYFDDNNQNGAWDPGERFIDQGEPFVDANDNGVWDPGETYFDANHNGMYDGPNGVYDSNTTIWTEFRVLYTGRPVPDVSYVWLNPSPFSAACPAGVPRGGTVWLDAHFADQNLNRPQSDQVTFAVSHTAQKGSVQMLPTILDGYGFGMERLLVNASAGPSFEQACTPTTAICKWKVLFYDWGVGQVNPVQIQGASPADTTACTPDTVAVSATVLSVITTVYDNGAIQ